MFNNNNSLFAFPITNGIAHKNKKKTKKKKKKKRDKIKVKKADHLDKQQRGEAGSWCRSASAILNKTKTKQKQLQG